MKIGLSNVCTAFMASTVGSKVLNKELFMGFLERALKSFVFPENGQGFIVLPTDAYSTVRAGVARLEGMQDKDLVAKMWRGRPQVFGNSAKAAKTEFLAVVVYTKDAYSADPDVIKEGRVVDEDFIIVAVLASAGPKPPYAGYALVHNIAGGNNEFLPTGDPAEDQKLLNSFITKAKETEAYEKDWITVAD